MITEAGRKGDDVVGRSSRSVGVLGARWKSIQRLGAFNGCKSSVFQTHAMQQGLAQHPLAAKMGDSPAEVIAAAASITPQLPSLFAHPLLQEGGKG